MFVSNAAAFPYHDRGEEIFSVGNNSIIDLTVFSLLLECSFVFSLSNNVDLSARFRFWSAVHARGCLLLRVPMSLSLFVNRTVRELCGRTWSSVQYLDGWDITAFDTDGF